MANDWVAVFDLGGVVIDWNPRHLYRKLFDGEEAAMESFLATVCTSAWNEQQNAGRSFADGCASLKQLHPDKAELVDAWFERYDETFGETSQAPSASSEICARGVYLSMRSATGR